MSAIISDQSVATASVTKWLASFDQVLQSKDTTQLSQLFVDDCYWRDLVSFTWNIKTMEGKEAIQEMVNATISNVEPFNWQIEGEASQANGITEAWITFETKVCRGKGHVRLKGAKCWTLLTTMVELKGFEEKKESTRVNGVEHGSFKERLNWREEQAKLADELGYTKQPYCVIIGGGQGGIALGARLKQLEVPTLIIEKNKRPGDSWRKRYRSLCLHDPVWYDHLPYIPFPDNWPVFSPKDKIGDWLEYYTKVMELNYWDSSVCQKAHYNESKQEWEVEILREGTPLILRPKQLVLATGMSGKPKVPVFAGADNFKGEQHHSSLHRGGRQYEGQKCIVVGSNNSAHDIAAGLWEMGADVTMIQRSTTHIARSETLMDLVLGDLYSEKAVQNGIDHHTADLIFASVPYKIMPEFHIPIYKKMAEVDADFYAGLKSAGFLLDFGDDDSGLFMKYLRRGSGYYIDVGASQLIIDGKVKLKSGVNIDQIDEDSVTLTDGTVLPADLIVYATGYNSMNGWAADLISQTVADKVGKCWGLGSNTKKDPGPWEGELRNMWKPTYQKGLWFHGGNLHQSRHYSQFLALQIKARLENIPTPVYGMTKVHHLS